MYDRVPEVAWSFGDLESQGKGFSEKFEIGSNLETIS